MIGAYLELIPWVRQGPGWATDAILLAVIGAGLTLLARDRLVLKRALGTLVWAGLLIVLLLGLQGHMALKAMPLVSLNGDPQSILVSIGLVIAGIFAWILSAAAPVSEERRQSIAPILFVLVAGAIGAITASDLLVLVVWQFAVGASVIGLVLILRASSEHNSVRSLMTIETVCLFSAGVALAILGSGLPSVSSGAGTLAVGLAMLLLLLVTRIASLVAALSLVTRARAPALGVEVAIGAVAVPAMLDALVGLIEALRPLLPGPFVLVMAVAAGIALVVGAVFAIGARDCGWRIAAIATSLIGLAVLGACEGAKTSLMFVLLWLGPVPAFLAASSIAGRVDRGGLAITPQALTAQIDAIRLLLAAACLAIIGLPPFAGFWARLILVQAAWSHADYAVVAATLISSLILCYALARRSFEPVTAAADDSRLASVRRVAASELLVLGVMSGLSLAGGLYPAPFIEISQMARGSSPQHHLELTEHP